MATASPAPPQAEQRSTGRRYLWSGIALCILSIGLVIVQYSVRLLIVPWYAPVLTTLGALLVIFSFSRRRTVVRLIAAGLLAILAGLEWQFLTSSSKLPEYRGPARAGQSIPPFATMLADGTSFTDDDLRDNRPTVLVFFRGRW